MLELDFITLRHSKNKSYLVIFLFSYYNPPLILDFVKNMWVGCGVFQRFRIYL